METCVYKIACIRIVAAAFFILEKNKWKQPRGPSEVNWINKLCVHIREYYTAIKRNDLLIHRKMGEFQRHYVQGKNPVPEEDLPHDSIFNEFRKTNKLIHGDRNQSSLCLGGWG